jgi:hypothetical protein
MKKRNIVKITKEMLKRKIVTKFKIEKMKKRRRFEICNIKDKRMMIKIANGEKITVKIHNDEDEKEK